MTHEIVVTIPKDQFTPDLDPSALALAPLEWTNVQANVVHLTPADATDRNAVVRYEVDNEADAERLIAQMTRFSWTVHSWGRN